MTNQVIDNKDSECFELAIGDHVAFAAYRLDGNTITIPHVEAPQALRGTGAAGQLMEGVVQIARERGQKIYPVCSYAVAWLNRHPEHQDILA